MIRSDFLKSLFGLGMAAAVPPVRAPRPPQPAPEDPRPQFVDYEQTDLRSLYSYSPVAGPFEYQMSNTTSSASSSLRIVFCGTPSWRT